jgi:hypothetical protein
VGGGGSAAILQHQGVGRAEQNLGSIPCIAELAAAVAAVLANKTIVQSGNYANRVRGGRDGGLLACADQHGQGVLSCY